MNNLEKNVALTFAELAIQNGTTELDLPFELLRLGASLRENQSDQLENILNKFRDTEKLIKHWEKDGENIKIKLSATFPLPDESEIDVEILSDKFIRRVLLYRLYQEYRSTGDLYTHYPLANLTHLLGLTKEEVYRHVSFLHNEFYLEYNVADGGNCTSELTNEGLKLCENRHDLFEEFSVMKAHETEDDEPIAESTSQYVASSRINELKAINNPNYDLTKLIKLCEEINIAHKFNCIMTITMILRAIIDHVPPIFKANTFGALTNNYNGGKSFKDLMIRLESSLRKIADSHLHTQISRRETLPTFTQVNFSAELDVLLAEIVKILK